MNTSVHRGQTTSCCDESENSSQHISEEKNPMSSPPSPSSPCLKALVETLTFDTKAGGLSRTALQCHVKAEVLRCRDTAV